MDKVHAMKSYTHRFSNPDGISEFRTLQTQQVQSGSRFPLLRDLIHHNNSLSATQSQMGSRRREGEVVWGRLVMEFCRFKQNNNWGQIDPPDLLVSCAACDIPWASSGWWFQTCFSIIYGIILPIDFYIHVLCLHCHDIPHDIPMGAAHWIRCRP